MCDVEAWFFVQQCVDSFTDRCTKLARRLANFIKIIQQEDISLLDNYDCMREVRAQNWFYFLTLLLYTTSLQKNGNYSKNNDPKEPKLCDFSYISMTNPFLGLKMAKKGFFL